MNIEDYKKATKELNEFIYWSREQRHRKNIGRVINLLSASSMLLIALGFAGIALSNQKNQEGGTT